MERKVLEAFVGEGLTVEQMATRLGRSPTNLRYWLAKHDLNGRLKPGRKADSHRRELLDKAIREGRKVVTSNCERHGVTEFAVTRSPRRLRCKKCRAEAVARRRYKVKMILVEEAGGCCMLCGYDRCIAALEFHHIDPATKEFGIAMRGLTKSLDRLREEARKCVLLCANCHAEVGTGFTTLALESCQLVLSGMPGYRATTDPG